MKRVFKLGIVLGMLFSVFSMAEAAAADCKISGTVTDSISGEGIPFVTVGVENTDGKVLSRVASDVNGRFTTTAAAGNRYTLVISSVGYSTQRIDLSIPAGERNKDMGNIVLTEGTELSEVTVVAQRPLIKSDIDKITYDMEADPEATSNNALDMLRKVPMITVDAEENIRLNGQSNYKVLLNGKSSAIMSGDNVKDVLKSMPASSIKNIEVITNPSSKYEAEGVGGIINIVTVTRRDANGIVGSVGANADNRGGFGGNVYLSSQIGKFAFSGRYSGNRYTNGHGGHSKTFSETYDSDEFNHSEGYGKSRFEGLGHNISLEASYEIDTLNLISFSAWGWLGSNQSNSNLDYTYYNRANAISSQYGTSSHSHNNYGSVSGTLDYQRSFAKKDRTLTASYQFEYTPNNSDYTTESNGIVNWDSYIERSKNKAHGTEQTVQIDYFDPLTEMHQIEGGAKYIMRCNVSDGDRTQSLWDEPTDTWNDILLPVNDLDYTQHILGLYAGYVLKIKKWSGKVGARLESTWNDGRTTNYDETATAQKIRFDNDFFNIVPYVTLSWQPREMQTFKLSYTQRLSRPGIWQLNPFKDSSSPMQLTYGNPQPRLGSVAYLLAGIYSLYRHRYELGRRTERSPPKQRHRADHFHGRKRYCQRHLRQHRPRPGVQTQRILFGQRAAYPQPLHQPVGGIRRLQLDPSRIFQQGVGLQRVPRRPLECVERWSHQRQRRLLFGIPYAGRNLGSPRLLRVQREPVVLRKTAASKPIGKRSLLERAQIYHAHQKRCLPHRQLQLQPLPIYTAGHNIQLRSNERLGKESSPQYQQRRS